MFLLVKSTGKSWTAEESEKFCDDSPVPVSAPEGGGTLLTQVRIAGLWGIWFKCPHNSPSSHFPSDSSDSLGFFLRQFGRTGYWGLFLLFSPGLWTVLQGSSSRLCSLQYATPPCSCLHFYSMVQVPTAAARRDQHWSNPTGAIRCSARGWELMFSFFSSCPQQEQQTRSSVSWQRGRDLRWVTGTCQFRDYEGDIVPMQKLLFSQPVARGCPLWAMEGALCSCWGCLHPPAVMPSVKHRLWRKDHPSGCRKLQIIPRLC